MRNFSKVMIRVCVVLLFVFGLQSAVRFGLENWKLATVMSKQERKELEGTLDTLYCGTSIAYCAYNFGLQSAVRFGLENWKLATVMSKQERKELEGTLDTLYCGTSIAYCAYNPLILDEKLGTFSFNLGTASQPCVGTYYLVRETIEKNPIKQIYLTLSIPTLKAERLPERYLSAFETMRSVKWKLAYLAAVKDNDLTTQALFYSTRVELEDYTKTKKIRSNIENKRNPGKKVEGYEERGFRSCEKYYHSQGPIENSENNYWHGDQGAAQLDPEAVTYMKKLAEFCKKKDIRLTMVVVPWSQDYIDAAGDLDNGAAQLDPEAVTYMKKLAEFCKKKDIRLTMVVVPWSQDYIDAAGDLDNMDQVCRDLAEEMGVEYYNFLLYKNRQKLFSDYAFKDEQHLNTTGGNMFSALLADVVTSDDPDSYFYESMADFSKAEDAQNK